MLLELLANVEGSLNSGSRLQGMQTGELRHVCHLLIDDRIILHRATAQGIEPVVHAKVVLTVIGIVSHHGHLVALGQGCVLIATERSGDVVVAKLVLRQGIATTAFLG